MSPLIAQVVAVELEEICGEPGDRGFLCELVFHATDRAWVAAAAGVISTTLFVLVLVVGAVLATMLARRAINRFSRTMERRIQRRLERGEARGTLDVARYRIRRFQRLHAVTGVLRGAAGVVIWLTTTLLVLDTIGVRLQPILAGAGLAGIIIGFGAQQLVRDVLAGIAMLVEDQYGGGDWIEVDGKIGQVERVGLRATSFRDLDGAVWHVANGHIQQVGNLSQEWSRSMLDVPLALDSDVPTAKAIIHRVATELAEDPVWGEDIIGPPEIWGVQDFGPQGLSIRLVMPTKPMTNWDINRQLRERLHHAFERANIRMQGQLVELGGMAVGYPVLQRPLDDERREARTQRRGRGLAPQDGSPADHPSAREQRELRRDERTLEDAIDDPYADRPDQTAELRLERGPEPRPD